MQDEEGGEINNWRNIVEVASGQYHAVGVKADGTVVAAWLRKPGYDDNYGQCNVSSWKNIMVIRQDRVWIER